ncbi:hypothetical protein F4777DRAFT_3945 [Nemania sp. FL0916]|nr:hypothetical protein F4777DRAFT_3945 [Nemania sp. FL0916]
MPPKDLFGGVVKVLTRKASRPSVSTAPRENQSDAREEPDGDRDAPERASEQVPEQALEQAPRQDLSHPATPGSESGTAPPVSATTAVSHDEDTPTVIPKTTSSADCVVAEPTSAPAPAPTPAPAPAPALDLAPTTVPAPVPTSPTNSELDITESRILDLATASFPPISEDAELPPLPKPVVVPRINPGRAIPFARVWVPELANHGITQEDFVAFIDNLNIIITPHLAFRLLQVASFAVGMVPYDVAEGVGGALGAIATIGTFATNYKRTKDYLALMNEKYFHPRKLHMKVTGTKRLKKLLRLDKKDPCLAPLTEQTLELSAQERCLQYLSQYSCELSFDVPAPSPATVILAKMTAWEIKHKVAKADRAARWGRKRAWKRHQKGKPPQDRLTGRGERLRVRTLDWIIVQNIEEWKAQKAEKEAKKEAKRARQGRTRTWLTINK